MPRVSRKDASDGFTADAYVRLRVLPTTMVGRLRWWHRLARELRAELISHPSPARIRRAGSVARAGFYPSSHSIYDLRGPARGDYLSDRQRELTWSIDWPAAGLLDDKLAFFFMLKHLEIPTPEVTGVVVQGRVHAMGASEPDPSADWLKRRLQDRGRVIVRPTRGGGGRALWVLESSSVGYRLNGEAVSWDELRERMGRLEDHVISDFVEQAAYARKIFSATTNTLRVLTMYSPQNGPLIAAAVHRIGTPASAPADNWSKGGLSVAVDPDSGVLGKGVLRPRDGVMRWMDRHPSTEALISGIAIPGWTALRERLLELAAGVPFLPYVGWDIIVTDDGFSVIEGNKYSDVNLLQVHKPILADARARSFYAEFGLA
jgi:hypothetical protein